MEALEDSDWRAPSFLTLPEGNCKRDYERQLSGGTLDDNPNYTVAEVP